MTTYDNAPPPPGWVPTPRHCGQLCTDVACTVCGEFVPRIPANIQLAEN